jgi:nucleoside-diphosphate-sugar epimerase
MGRILVTGATGLTGGALARRLARNGEHVVAWARSGSDVSRLDQRTIEVQTVDITDAAAVAAHFRDFDTVYHIAAVFREEPADRDVFRRVNVEATRHLLTAAAEHGVQRFVHCSTVGVHGEIEDPPADENYRFSPEDHYQRSKLEGELLAREFMERGLPVTVIRPTGIYGPGDRRFLKLFRAIDRRRFVFIGRGDSLYHMTHVDDLVDAFILAGTRPEAVGQVFTIGGADCPSIRQLVDGIADVLHRPRPRLHIPFVPVYWASFVCEALCRPLGISPPLYPRRVRFFHFTRSFTIDKARRVLGYEPRVGLATGLAATAAWYRAARLL